MVKAVLLFVAEHPAGDVGGRSCRFQQFTEIQGEYFLTYYGLL